jgi:hypothetical protein
VINLYYDDLIKGNGASEIVRPFPSLPEHLRRLNIKFTINKTHTIVNAQNFNMYPIELFRMDLDIDQLFKKIDSSTVNYIRANNIKILVYFPYEGFDLSLYSNWFKKLHELFLNYKYEGIKKYFVFNNMYIEELYNIFLKDNPELTSIKFDRVFGYSFFHSDSYFNLIAHNIKLNNNNTTKNKNFVCYNSQLRPHRLFLVSELKRRNLLENSYVSMLGTYKNYPDTSFEYAKTTTLSILEHSNFINTVKKYCIDYLNNWEPLLLDKNQQNVDSINFELTHFQDSYFSVVTETGMGYPLRVSEKTFKPIANKHPFIIVGCAHTLKYIKSLGYETFPELFDESYDAIEDNGHRLLAIIDQIESFCKLSDKEKDTKFNLVKDKLEHNYNNYMIDANVKHMNEFNNLLEEIKND